MKMNKNPSFTNEVVDIPIPEPVDAGFDNPDERDWDYSAIIGESGWSDIDHIRYLKDFLYIFNQGADPLTLNSCGWCWLIHNINAQTILSSTEWHTNQISVKSEWMDYNQTRDESRKYRWTEMQANMKYFINELKYIAWYWKLNSIEEAKAAIDNRHFIYTWSNNGDWTHVRLKKVYKLRTDKKLVGHLFCIVWYNEEWFIAINSYWSVNWYFTIPYSLYDTLYSKYAILPAKDLSIVMKYRMAKTIQESITEALKEGITDGTRMDEAATRAEVVAMVVRGIDVAIKRWEDLFAKK